MKTTLLALVLAAAPTTAPETIKSPHQLKGKEAQRLFDALKDAGVAPAAVPEGQRVAVEHLVCGMANAPTPAESKAGCTADKLKVNDRASKAIFAAVTEAHLPTEGAMMSASCEFWSVSCTASATQGVTCTLSDQRAPTAPAAPGTPRVERTKTP